MENVARYGYLYNWPAVMHGASSSEANPSGVQGICPNGCHVPSDAEWLELFDYMRTQPAYISGGVGHLSKALAATTIGATTISTTAPIFVVLRRVMRTAHTRTGSNTIVSM